MTDRRKATGLVNKPTRLLGLDGVAVTSVRLDDDANPMIALVTRDDQAQCCPGCGARSENPHGWVRTRPRDLAVAGRPTALTWTKRRWQCRTQDCPRRTFTEALPQIPSRSRLTGRLRVSAGAAVADRGRTVLQSARDHEISWPIVQAAFAAHAAAALPERVPDVEHLGIDETRRGKAKFRLVPGPDGGEVWEVVADRWHIGFVDLTGGAGLLGRRTFPFPASGLSPRPSPPAATPPGAHSWRRSYSRRPAGGRPMLRPISDWIIPCISASSCFRNRPRRRRRI